MFKQLTAYRLGKNFTIPTAAAIEAALQPRRYLPIGLTQEKSVGFYPPRGNETDALVEVIDGHYIMRLYIETKSVPARTIREEVDTRCKDAENITGRKPGKKARREIADEVLRDLLPAAFPKLNTVTIWIDPERRVLALNTASQSKCDEVNSALINLLADLHVSYIITVQNPQPAMASWLLAESPDDWPDNFNIERECVLKSNGEDGATVKFSKHHLATDEVKKHVLEGKLPQSLALSWDGKVSFVLAESMQLKKIQYLDGVMDEAGTDKNEDRFDADVALSTGLLGPLLDDLIYALGGEMKLETP
jgi:recombination associated protein RdgC